MAKKILFVYRTARNKIYEDWQNGKGPDSLLFGANHLKKYDYDIDFFDIAYSPLNFFHPLFYPLEHAIIGKTGMGFKLDQASTLFPKFRNYDVIVATGDSAGLPLLALKYFGLVKKPIIFMTAGLAGALKGKNKSWVFKFYKNIFKEADIFTSYAQIEIDFFEKEMGIKKGKIIYIPLSTDYQYFSRKKQTRRDIICSVGVESGRDYKTLFEAVSDLPVKVEVACHPDNIRGLTIPDNVKIHLNVPVSKVLEIYQRSLISIVPCLEKYRSSGQMVVLESAAAGLPIIAAKIHGITSAFDFQEGSHLLYFRPEDSSDLRGEIRYLLANPKIAKELGKNASNFVKKNYTTQLLAKRLANLINRL